MIEGCTPTIFVSDMQRAVDFYTKTLGLAEHFRAGDHFAMIDAGGGMLLGLHPPSAGAAAPGTAGNIEIGLNVTEPIESVVEALQSRGVAFDARGAGGPIVDDGPVKLAFFADPDGTRLYLCETVEQATS